MPLIQENPSQLLRNAVEHERYISREDFVQELHEHAVSEAVRPEQNVSSLGSVVRGLRDIITRG